MTFHPLLPWPLLAVVVGGALAVTALRWRNRNAPRAPILRSLAMTALVVVAASDPAVGGGRLAARRSDADVLFVVDTTGSMGAEDYDGGRPRLDGVRADVMALVSEFPGAHFAVITFDSKARVVVPWTTDVAAIDSAVGLLRQERTLYAQGSQLDMPLAAMTRSLPRAEADGSDQVVFYFSDGEQTAGNPPASFRALNRSVNAGAVLGYGTADGGRMRLYTGREQALDQYIHDDQTGTDAISTIDEDNLQKIAADLGISYVQRSAPGGLEALAGGIADVSTHDDGHRGGAHRLYWIPAFGLVMLAGWQFAVTALEAAEARRIMGRATRGVSG